MIIESNSIFSERIPSRSLDFCIPITARKGYRLLICHDKENIRFFFHIDVGFVVVYDSHSNLELNLSTIPRPRILTLSLSYHSEDNSLQIMKQPNVLFIFGDQWRKQALGYEGDPNVKTPNLDAFASQSVNMVNAISGTPVCTPYRASLLTGQRPLTHGLFLNDACLSNHATSIAGAFSHSGYDTAYIGKWHVDGHGRSGHIPPERRQGFDYWKVLECTHNYNNSPYYSQDEEEKKVWDGYDAYAQTIDLDQYLRSHSQEKPFLAMLSWGPPHNPYETAPQKYADMYSPEDIQLRDNVPSHLHEKAKLDLSGYYAHCTALDDCFGRLMKTLDECGLSENTIVVFSSDHGDMISSQGEQRKQRPWAESARVPFLVRFPDVLTPGTAKGFIDAPDIMPTLLDLCGLPIPESVEGQSFADHMKGESDPSNGMGVVACYHPFGEFIRDQGGREYRALITDDFTYCKTLDGPWLMFNDAEDPFQMENLVESPEWASSRDTLDQKLDEVLKQRGDHFEHGDRYIEKWGYKVNPKGTLNYTT